LMALTTKGLSRAKKRLLMRCLAWSSN